MRASLIFNPASGRGASKPKRLHRLLERLNGLGIDAEPAPTSSPGHATMLAQEAVDQDVDLVLVWGGDGTLNEVAWEDEKDYRQYLTTGKPGTAEAAKCRNP